MKHSSRAARRFYVIFNLKAMLPKLLPTPAGTFSLALLICAIALGCNHSDPKITSAYNAAYMEHPKVESQEMESVPSAEQVRRDSFTTAYLMGKFEPATHPDFVLVDIVHADREGHYLRRDTYQAFKNMYNAALQDGVRLKIISATRNFNRQKEIWEAKWTGSRLVDGENIAQTIPDPVQRALKILEYSSMPGSSRHHWGTDIDLNALSDAYFLKGDGMKIFEWLSTHAHEYGFCRPYSPQGPDRPNGYFEEKWHWSYQPVAKQLTQLARTQLRDDMIEGFQGAETARRIGIVSKYVLGVNGECLK